MTQDTPGDEMSQHLSFRAAALAVCLVFAWGNVTAATRAEAPPSPPAPETRLAAPWAAATPVLGDRTARDDQAIIVDHRSIDLSRIPEAWLARARSLTLHYGHTSHGSQVMTGIERLARDHPSLAVAVKRGGPVALPYGDDALRVYDGNNPDTYITPELYWSAPEGIAKTRSVAETGLFDYSMWSWCGQQSSNRVETVQAYLGQLDRFETEFPEMRFIYMTGHTDGGSETLNRNNDLVRAYAVANGKILFDFADIESYDPDGNHHPGTSDACPWCQPWCDENPAYCSDLPGSCAHSHPLNCKLKGQAFWWMMARLAGWPGPGAPPETPSPTSSPTATRTATMTSTATSSPAPSTGTPPTGEPTPTGGSATPATAPVEPSTVYVPVAER